jgi:hypothetical protein
MGGSLSEEPQCSGAAGTGDNAVDTALTGVQISMLQNLQRGVLEGGREEHIRAVDWKVKAA